MRIFDGPPPHTLLRELCASPYHFFRRGAALPVGTIIPLWESSTQVTAYQDGMPQGFFIKFSLEQPLDIEVLGHAFHSASADVLLQLWEGECSDEEIRAIAAMFEFPHTEKFLAVCSESSAHAPSEYDQWRGRLLESFR